LQAWLPFFYPERLDLVAQLQEAAVALQGHLALPELPWKYRWIQKLFGWNFAKRTRMAYNRSKSAVLRNWDKAWFQLEVRRQENARTMLTANRFSSIVP
jgi:hypothetical protein